MRLPLETLKTAKEIFQAAQPAAQPMNLMETVTAVAAAIKTVKELFSPATNSISEMTSIISALKAAGLMPGGEKTNMGVEIVRQLPAFGEIVANGLREIRLTAEAEAQKASYAASRGLPPQAPASSVAAARANMRERGNATMRQEAPPVPTAANPGPSPEQVNQQMGVEWLEHQIAQMVINNVTGVEAGVTLQNIAPDVVEQFKNATADEIIQLFQTRPILAQIANHPRLRDFIKEFHQWAKAKYTQITVEPEASSEARPGEPLKPKPN